MASGGLIRPGFERLREQLPEIQQALRDAGLGGWLLYDLHARNPVARALVGQGDLTRRYFVLLPADGEPTAVIHGIEEAPWERWPWPRRRYVGWKELAAALEELLGPLDRVAMEAVDRDAVPAIDYVPWGVVELIRAAGPDVVPSGELITRFYARWTAEQLESHRRAARALADTAREAFEHLADRVRSGADPHEGEMREWVIARLRERGVGTGADCIFAKGVNAANPHYGIEGRGAALGRGDVVLLDLWAKESEEMVYADQTWMAVLGPDVDDHVQRVWEAVRDARDAGVALLRERWDAGRTVQGYEVDDAVRGVISRRGFGEAFFHRTGHSIDRDTHGSGPNIDNLETHEVRTLIPGIGFSIEPGIYLAGDVGIRSEIDVYIDASGPEVTPPEPQREIFRLLAER